MLWSIKASLNNRSEPASVRLTSFHRNVYQYSSAREVALHFIAIHLSNSKGGLRELGAYKENVYRRKYPPHPQYLGSTLFRTLMVRTNSIRN